MYKYICICIRCVCVCVCVFGVVREHQQIAFGHIDKYIITMDAHSSYNNNNNSHKYYGQDNQKWQPQAKKKKRKTPKQSRTKRPLASGKSVFKMRHSYRGRGRSKQKLKALGQWRWWAGWQGSWVGARLTGNLAIFVLGRTQTATHTHTHTHEQ